MRVGFSLTYYRPYVSGLTIIVERLAEEMAKLEDYDVTVVCMRHDQGSAERETINQVRVIRAKPDLRISKGFFSWDWIVKSWAVARECDVVFINLPQPEGVVLAIFAKCFGKKIIANYLAEVKLRSGVGVIVEKLLSATNRLIMFLATKVVTYSTEYARYAKELRGFEKKTTWIYPPIPQTTVNTLALKKLKKKILAFPNTIKVGVQARLAEDKGFEYLFEAIPMIEKLSGNPTKIIIAGSLDPVGEVEYKKKILNLADKFIDKIVFLGELAPEDMGSFYQLIDVLVYPSILESFGLGQVEAMMVGIPVVTTNLPGASVPIKRTGGGILVPSKNSTQLAKAIVKAVSNPTGYQNVEKAKRIFNIKKTIKSYVDLCLD